MMLQQAHDSRSASLHSKAARSLATPTGEELELLAIVAKYAYRPTLFVQSMFPWGKPGTLLANETGPDTWQAEVLDQLGADMRAGLDAKTSAQTAIKYAIASGHGIGKTALVAWIILWFISCFDYPQIVVTANTRTQLLTKTWRELAKWHRMATNSHWFEWTATSLKHRAYPDTWFASAIPWSVGSTEAFAGTHETHVLVLFDEASAIDDAIWQVTEGAMTTASAIWICFGNPTKNTGAFFECFGRMKHRWRTWQIDSRTAKKANRAQIDQSIADYGEDSDFVRVRWRGVFPRAGSMQLISGESVRLAMQREALPNEDHAKILGLDIARHGDDQSSSVKRQGQKTWPVKRYRITDLMLLAQKFCEDIDEFGPDGVFIDVTGMGWGVYDRLRQLRPRVNLYPVQVGETAIEDQRFYNRRAEIWWRIREWLEAGGCLPHDIELEADLTGIEYGYDTKERVQLEKKEDMKARGLASPDSADALALTFTTTLQPNRPKSATWRDRLRQRTRTETSPQAA